MKRMSTQWMAGALAGMLGLGLAAATAQAQTGEFVPLANIAATAQNNQYSDIADTVAWLGMDRGSQAAPDKNALASNDYNNQWTPGAANYWGKWHLDRTAANESFRIAEVFWWQYSQAGQATRGITNAKLYYSNMETDPGAPGDGNGNWTKFFDNTGGTAFPLSGGVNNHHVTVSISGLSFDARWIGILPTTPSPQDGNGLGTILFTKGIVGAWATPSVSDVTTTTASASAVTDTALDVAKLLWDTEDKGTDDPADWTLGNLSLGAQAADATVSGQMTGLAADTRYTVRFYGEHGVETEWSMARTFATALTPAQTPAFTSAVTTFQSVTLQWTDNANTETGYVLRRANSPSGPFAVIAELGPNATSYLDAGLLGETTYHYQLAAVNSVNGSSTAFESCVTQATTAARPLGKIMFSSPVPPSVTGVDIASFGTSVGTDKWWNDAAASGRTIGQTFTTPSRAVLFNAFTFRVAGAAEVHPTKTYVLRLGTVSGTTFTEFHSETFTQNFVTNFNDYWTYQVESPVALEPDTLYGVDVGMTASTSAWQTGIPYPHVTADVHAGGTRFRSGTLGVGTATMVDVSGERIFHVNLLLPPPAGTIIMIR